MSNQAPTLPDGAPPDLADLLHLADALRTPACPRPCPAHVDSLYANLAVMGTICGSMDVVVYVADFETHDLLFVNHYTEGLFGGGWRGKRCYEYLQQGKTGPCEFCTNERLVKDGEAQPPHVWEFQNTINRNWYMCIDRAIQWTDRRLVRLEVAVDVTARKELDLLREQYMALLSHDLRSAVHAIHLNTVVLERQLQAGATDRAMVSLGRVTGSAERLDAMLLDLLETMRLESPTLELARQPIDLGELAGRIVSLLGDDDRARVTLACSDRGALVLADAARVERVLDNLVGNALKHSPADTAVRVEVAITGDTATVAVTDEGEGIPPEALPLLFERFYRLPGTKAHGLGLGLYIARLIVERHGGCIRAESQPGHGASFTFTLPRGETAS